MNIASWLFSGFWVASGMVLIGIGVHAIKTRGFVEAGVTGLLTVTGGFMLLAAVLVLIDYSKHRV